MAAAHAFQAGEPTAKDLAQACRDGKIATVRALLARGISPNEVCEFGGTALTHAVYNDQREIVQLLLDEAGANPEAVTEGKTTSLILAATRNLVGVAKILIAKGANLEAREMVRSSSIAGLRKVGGSMNAHARAPSAAPQPFGCNG